MTRGKFDTKEAIKNPEIVALFGYLVRCNNQIHDFQNKVIKEYLERKGVSYTFIHDVIFFKDDAVSLENALMNLRSESSKIKAELLFYLVVVSEIDGITDFEEQEFFDKIFQTSIIEDFSDVVAAAKKKAVTERKKYKKSNSVKNTGKRANPNSTDNLFRITQKEYISAIAHCRKIAKEDYEIVKPIAEGIVIKGENFYSDFDSNLKRSIDFHPEVIESLENFSKAIEREVLAEVVNFQREFAKKETTVEDFTIALIGRTKAGKSTLRAVLTGQGKENIGCGAQRTTRINDIYEWNHLRIIDTPGIDAGADADDEDQKIAEKVIGESDIICYLAASDGLPKNAREFAVNLAKRNKPVIVLVNYKSNINSSSRFRRFIENPSGWRQSDNSNTIDGYFYPIKRLAEENGVSELISYQAVFLYAELLSKDENYREYSKILNENSGVNEFLVQLKDAVVNKGAFLRSKTIIDDTIVECLRWVQRVEELVSPINSMHHSLFDERNTTKKKIEKSRALLLSTAEKIIKESFNRLATTEASVFAEVHYVEKGDIAKAWEEHCKKIGFYDKLKTDIDEAFQSFSGDVSSIINDLLEDLQFGLSGTFSGMNIKAPNGGSFPFREVFRFAGAGLSLAGSLALIIASSNPVGWILTGVGIVVGLVANLFKSKAKRQQKEKDNLYNRINKAVCAQSEKFLEEVMGELKKQSDECISLALSRYDNLLDGLKFTSNYCDELIIEINSDIDGLNIRFAERILEYISGEEIVVSNVERAFGKYIKIYPAQPIDIESCDFSKVEGVLNEKIEICEF